MMRALSIDETAQLLGRTADWLRTNWRLWHKAHGLPKPIHEHGTHVWDAAQVYAWLDRERPLRERAFAAAFRAAYASVINTDLAVVDELAAARQRLAAKQQQERVEA